MALQSVLVTDTNIWIDLENGGILVEVFQLPFRFFVPDFAIPELVHPRWETLEVLGLEAQELIGEQVVELVQLRHAYKNLSIVDLAAFLLTKTLGGTLLTGDRRLVELANSTGLAAHGVLWLLDELIYFQALASTQAAAALVRMLDFGARLPVEECKERLARWSK